MRLFVALTPPPDEQERIYRAAAPLRAAALPVRWTRAEALHLTLRFLGEVAPEAVPPLEHAIATAVARAAPFTLRLGGFGAFPSLARPRVLWMGAAAAPELLRLREELEREFEPLGFAPEVQPFRPHLTLGRARRGAARGDIRRLAALLAGIHCEASVAVREVELLRSHLTPEGSRYERVAALPLG